MILVAGLRNVLTHPRHSEQDALLCSTVALRKVGGPDIKIDRLCTCGYLVIDV